MSDNSTPADFMKISGEGGVFWDPRMVDGGALDALREAVKGCGKYFPTTGSICGDYLVKRSPTLCEDCDVRRDAAISRLLGTTDNGGVE